MALSAGIPYRNGMVNNQPQSIIRHRPQRPERGRVLPMLPLASGRALRPRQAQPASRVVTDAGDWLDREHARSIRGRTCGAVVA